MCLASDSNKILLLLVGAKKPNTPSNTKTGWLIFLLYSTKWIVFRRLCEMDAHEIRTTGITGYRQQLFIHLSHVTALVLLLTQPILNFPLAY